MLVELERYGEVCGIELDEDAAELARARRLGEVRIGRLEELPWEAGAFDLITAFDVIEHTPDDRRTLGELRRVCAPGGWLLVTVPAYQALWSQHDEVNHHYRRYGRFALRTTAISAGWQVRRMTSFNSLLLAPAAVVRLTKRRRRDANYESELTIGPPWLNSVLEQPLRAEARWLATGHTLPFGLSLLALLEKPRTAS
jgi:SAM-dependent methyltransferase